MEIRSLHKGDLHALLSLYSHLHQETCDRHFNIYDSIWDEILSTNNILYFGGFIGELLVSSCHLVIVPNLTRNCHPYAFIENVVTHSEYRNKGYGKAVLKAATDHAWKMDCYKVMLMTGRKDERVLAFYQSAGFSGNEKQAFIAKP